jgi:hypothetical protein
LYDFKAQTGIEADGRVNGSVVPALSFKEETNWILYNQNKVWPIRNRG